jgi:diacylglycerol kinase (ATP)
VKTLFVVNPHAGRRRCGARWEALHRLLRQSNQMAPYEVVTTRGPGDAEQFTREAVATGYECIYAVGGDGTFHEVLNGVGDADVTIGIVPFGTGNDLARALRVPRQPVLLTRLLTYPTTIYINAAELGGRLFMLAAGFGFDGIVAHHINTHGAIKRMGPLGYAVSAFSILRRFRPATMRIEVDGEERFIEGAWMVVVANCPYYGGGMRICPQAACDDDWLDVCVVSDLTRTRFLRLFPRVYSGTHVRWTPFVRMLRGKRIVIDRPGYMLGHVDGELLSLADGPLEIRVAPRKFRVVGARQT